MSFQYYVSIKGTKQGQFKGESQKNGQKSKWLPCQAFQYGVESQYDAGSGQSSGRRTHNPVSVTKETGPASPQIFQAKWLGELLVEVVIETRHPGTEAVVERITLTNAVISKVHEAREIPHGVVRLPKAGLETVTFDYKEIKVEGKGA